MEFSTLGDSAVVLALTLNIVVVSYYGGKLVARVDNVSSAINELTRAHNRQNDRIQLVETGLAEVKATVLTHIHHNSAAAVKGVGGVGGA